MAETAKNGIIEHKYVVHETRGNTFFAGMNSNDFPIMRKLCSETRLYPSEKSAKMAIRRIGDVECCEFEPYYIDYAQVPEDKPALAAVGNSSCWSEVASIGRIKLMRREVEAGREMFGLIGRDGELKSAGIGVDSNVIALKEFVKELYFYLLVRMKKGG